MTPWRALSGGVPMRLLSCLSLLCLSAGVVAAAGPPPRVPPEVLKLIDQLGDGNPAARRAATKKLEALGERALPLLHKAGRDHKDADVRLRAQVVAGDVEAKLYGEVRRFTGHADGDVWFSLSPDGKKVVSCCWGQQPDHVVRVWEVKTGKLLLKLEGHTKGQLGNGVITVAWSPDGKRIASGGYDRTVRLWDAESGKHLLTLDDEHKDWIHAVQFTSDSKKLIVAAHEGSIRVWDLKAGKVERRIGGHEKAVRGLALVPGGKRFASAGFDGTVRVFEIETGKEVKRIDAHDGMATFVAVSPDGKRIASGGEDHLVKLWDAKT